MQSLKFYKNFQMTTLFFEHKVIFPEKTEKLAQLRQLRQQLYTQLQKYEHLVNCSFDLLEEQRDKYNNILRSNLKLEQSKKVASQLICDIQALNNFITQTHHKDLIMHYKTKLNSLNEQIRVIEMC